MTPMPNEVTFPINHALLASGLVVSDDAARRAMRFAFDRYKIFVEPGAAVGLAAVQSNRIDVAGRTIAAVVTGGNIDAQRFCALTGVDDG